MIEKRRAPPKNPDLFEKIRQCIVESRYRLSIHAIERKDQRDISLPDILYVLANGYEEKRKSSYDDKYKTWKYAIRGKTVDGDDIRVIASLVETGILVVTVIRLLID